ncbi:MAG: hypothetical protein DI539_04750 [Flavobacterium psychrophilum]|nr:MAG: hypothetical protein DI539_04750 [Flavobacterium psychrophilum]
MFVYILLLITFIVFPVAAIEIAKLKAVKVSNKILFAVGGFFLLHNFFFFIGISVIGDYIDCIIFALEYFFAFFMLGLMNTKKNIFLRGVGKFGTSAMVLSIIIGFFGIILFIVIAQDYESDRIYRYKCAGKTYQTRRYSLGFATSDYMRYSYDTYRTFAYAPLEYTIDTTSFLDGKTKLYPNSGNFKITFTPNRILFSDEEGVKLTKKLD